MERIYPTLLPKIVIAIAMFVAVVMLAITLRVVLRRQVTAKSVWKLFVFWTIAPSFWFALEYFWLFKEYGSDDTFEAFKYGQEGAQKFWAAIVALIGARLFKEIQSSSEITSSPRTAGDKPASVDDTGKR